MNLYVTVRHHTRGQLSLERGDWTYSVDMLQHVAVRESPTTMASHFMVILGIAMFVANRQEWIEHDMSYDRIVHRFSASASTLRQSCSSRRYHTDLLRNQISVYWYTPFVKKYGCTEVILAARTWMRSYSRNYKVTQVVATQEYIESEISDAALSLDMPHSEFRSSFHGWFTAQEWPGRHLVMLRCCYKVIKCLTFPNTEYPQLGAWAFESKNEICHIRQATYLFS